jgi:DNA-binding transcriptional ArsR family regulator
LARRDPARELRDTQRVFAALAHPSRRQILLVLRFHDGRMTAGEIARRFACSWPTTTRHLRQLEQAGLVTVEKAGRERLYRLDAERLQKVAGDWLGWFTRPHDV